MKQARSFKFRSILAYQSDCMHATVAIDIKDSDDTLLVDLYWDTNDTLPHINDIDYPWDQLHIPDTWDVCVKCVDQFINDNWSMILEELDKVGYGIVDADFNVTHSK